MTGNPTETGTGVNPLEVNSLAELSAEVAKTPFQLPAQDVINNMDAAQVGNLQARHNQERKRVNDLIAELQKRAQVAEASNNAADIATIDGMEDTLKKLRKQLVEDANLIQKRVNEAQPQGGDILDSAAQESAEYKKQRDALIQSKMKELAIEIKTQFPNLQSGETSQMALFFIQRLAPALADVDLLRQQQLEGQFAPPKATAETISAAPVKKGKIDRLSGWMKNRLGWKERTQTENPDQQKQPKKEKNSLEMKYIGYMPSRLNELVQALYLNPENGKSPSIAELDQFLIDLQAKGEVTNPHIQELVAALAIILRDGNIYNNPSFDDDQIKTRMQMTDTQMSAVKTSAEKAVSLMGSFDNENKKKFRKLALPLTTVLQPKPTTTTNP